MGTNPGPGPGPEGSIKVKRNLSLDVLRGVLSWIVVFVHIIWIAGYHRFSVSALGAWAVEGFIILSGFVITGLLLKRKERYGVFILRRYFRLFPAFAVCVALALAVRPLTHEPTEDKIFYHLGAHLALIHGLIPGFILPGSDMALLPPAWSISLEFQLYLITPLVLWATLRYGPKVLVALFTLSLLCLLPTVAFALSNWSTIGAFLPQRFFYFMTGMGLYFLTDAELLARLSDKWSQTPLRRLAVRLGEVSYSTYLVHWPVIMVINSLAVSPLWPQPVRLLLIAVLTVPSVLALSFLLYHYVELPGIELGRRLTKKKACLYQTTGEAHEDSRSGR